MTAPTLYFLKVTERINGHYEIWEQHMCQERGCVKTEPEFIELAKTKTEVKAIIDDWRINPPLNGVLAEVEWEELPKLPAIDDTDVTNDFCGEYSDLTELCLAMAELSNLKPYRVMSDDGRLLHYTFEVVE